MILIELRNMLIVASILIAVFIPNAASDEVDDFEEASQLFEAGNLSYALISIESALSIDSSDESFWDLKGDILAEMENQTDAISAYESALDLDPSRLEIRQKKCRILYEEKDYERCIECCDDNLGIQPTFESSKTLRAQAMIKYGSISGADYKLEKGYQKDRNQTQYWTIMELLNSTLEMDPNSTAAWNSKGILLGEGEEYTASISCFEEVLRINTSDNASLAAAWNNIGASMDRSGMHENSTEYYDKAISLDPLLAEAWSNQCKTMRLNMSCISCYIESKEYCRKAWEIDPELGTEFVPWIYKEII